MKKTLLSFFLLCNFIASYAQVTWNTPVDVAANTFSNRLPRIALDGSGDPLILWGKTNTHDALFSRWNGTQFTTPVALNQMDNVFADSWAGPNIASKGDTVYVVFKKQPEDANPVLITRSFDGGVNFSAPDSVESIGDSLSRFPVVAVDNSGNPLVGFMKFNSMFMDSRWVVAKSTDYGNNFSVDVLAGEYSGGEACDCCPGALISSGNYAAMLYRDNLNNTRDIWAGISSDNGSTFPNGIDLDDTDWAVNACPASGPDGVIIGDSLYSVFMSSVTGNSLVYYSRAALSSSQAGQSDRLTGVFSGLIYQNFPRIANAGNTTAFVWRQTVNGMDEAAFFLNNDITAGIDVPFNYEVVASSMNEIENVDIALAPGVVHIVWQDNGSGTVKYRKGTFTQPIGMNENSLSELSVFPNPVASELQVSNLQAANLQFSVTNLLGAQLISENVSVHNKKATLDVSSLAAGTYFLKVSSGNELQVFKIMKQ